MQHFLRRLWWLVRIRRVDAELSEEFEFHRSMAQREMEARGVPPAAARIAAARALGNTLAARDAARDVWIPLWLQGLSQDVRLAGRLLWATPLVSAAAILSLGLGIGATTAIFSIINSIYLRPLPVQSPDRLVYITGPTRTGRSGVWVWEQLRGRPDLFDGLAAYAGAQFNVSATTEARWVDGFWANGAFFRTLGVQPAAGRLFREEDDRPGGGPNGPVAVISHALWTREFGGTANAIGRSISVHGVAFTVIGVTPREFFGPTVGRAFDVVVPFGTAVLVSSSEGEISPDVMARLKPDQTLAQANAALAILNGDMRQGETRPRAGIAVEPPRAIGASTGEPPVGLRQQYSQPLSILTIVAGLVLLIACANIANLMLARATTRQLELSLRRALGGTRWRLARQCLVESLLLAGLGAAAGLLIAVWASRLLVRQLAQQDALTAGLTMYGNTRLFLDVSFDGRVLAWTIGVTIATGLLFGLAPAWRAGRAEPIGAIKQQAASATRAAALQGSPIARLRPGPAAGILVLQVALSLTLLVTAGLFGRTFRSLTDVPLGFEPDRVLTVDVDTRRAGTGTGQRIATSTRIAEAVERLPNVSAVALSIGTPPLSWGVRDSIEVAGAEPPVDPAAAVVLVSPGWFHVLGIPLLEGRDFTDRDRLGIAPVAVVNRAFARTFLDGANPIGRSIVSFESPIDIVGVAGDIVVAPRTPPPPVVFLPLAQAEGRLAAVLDFTLEEYGLTMIVRPRGGAPELLLRPLADRIGSIAPQVSLTFRSPREQIGALVVRERVLAMLSGFFAILALVLSALGLYGIAAYSVARQRKELAIRLALGAGTGRVVGLVLGRVLVPIALGIGVGLVLALWSTRFVAALLYGVATHDAATFVVAALVLVAVGTLAAWWPTRRALRIDPAIVLRYE